MDGVLLNGVALRGSSLDITLGPGTCIVLLLVVYSSSSSMTTVLFTASFFGRPLKLSLCHRLLSVVCCLSVTHALWLHVVS